MSSETNHAEIAPVSRGLLRELAEAWRGDWSFFDGRQLRSQLALWDTVLVLELAAAPAEVDDETKADVLALIATNFRTQTGLCSHGRGQWETYCFDYCKED